VHCPFQCLTTAAANLQLSVLKAAAAGGKFRGRLGRAIFQTTAVCQSVLQPDLVINKVRSCLFSAFVMNVWSAQGAAAAPRYVTNSVWMTAAGLLQAAGLVRRLCWPARPPGGCRRCWRHSQGPVPATGAVVGLCCGPAHRPTQLSTVDDHLPGRASALGTRQQRQLVCLPPRWSVRP